MPPFPPETLQLLTSTPTPIHQPHSTSCKPTAPLTIAHVRVGFFAMRLLDLHFIRRSAVGWWRMVGLAESDFGAHGEQFDELPVKFWMIDDVGLALELNTREISTTTKIIIRGGCAKQMLSNYDIQEDMQACKDTDRR